MFLSCSPDVESMIQEREQMRQCSSLIPLPDHADVAANALNKPFPLETIYLLDTLNLLHQ